MIHFSDLRQFGGFQLFRFGEEMPARIPPPFVTNEVPAVGIHDTIIVIDDQSILPGDEKRLGPAIDQYMAALEPAARIGLVTIQDSALNLSLTNDRNAVRAGLKALTGRARQSETADDAACRTRRALDALSSVADSFRPGGPPASVLFFTTGLTPPGTAQMSVMGSNRSAALTAVCEVQPRNYQAFQKTLLASAANLHVVEAALSPSQPMRAGLEELAGMSGNPVSAVVTGSEGAMASLANEMRGWYRATFMPEPGERTGEVQRVDVVSKRPGVKAEARSQVLIPRPTTTTQPKAPKEMLKEARVYRDFEMRAGVYFSQEPGSDKIKVLVLFEPAQAGRKATAASVALYDPAGKLTVQATADAATLARSPAMIAVLANPGRHRLRVAAVDDRGHAGTLDQDIDVGLIPAGPLKLATLVPGVQEGGFSARLVFNAADTAMAYVGVLGAPSAAALTGRLEILDSTGTSLGMTPTQVLDAPDGSRVIIGGLRLASMAPGDYQMSMVVILDGSIVGRTSHTFRRR